MRYTPYTPDNKTVINCIRCLNKLRVPTDKGKISVSCPVCHKEFVYNPNSILDTLKQIPLLIISSLPKNRKSRVILLIAAALVLIALLFMLAGGLSSGRKQEEKPGLRATALNSQLQDIKAY